MGIVKIADLVTERDGRASHTKLMSLSAFVIVAVAVGLHWCGIESDAALLGILAGFAGVSRGAAKAFEPRASGVPGEDPENG